MSIVTVQGNASGTGTLTIAAPNTNSNYTLTLPANTGTLVSTASTFAGTGPAFSAYLSTAQSIANNVFTKIAVNTEEFDTNSNYDNVTNYRFTPTVAGYYQISANIAFATTGGINSSVLCTIYKNGARFKDGNLATAAASGTGFYSVVSSLIYFNGSTDYVELYGLVNATGTITMAANAGTVSWFQGVLVRGA